MEEIKIKTLDIKKIYVGKGSNNFTMYKGSFNYDETIEVKKELSFEQERSVDNISYLDYRLAETGELFTFEVTNLNDGYDLKLLDDHDFNRYWLEFNTSSSEGVYGCGETFSKFNLKGEEVKIWVAEHQSSNRITEKFKRQEKNGIDYEEVEPFGNYESYYVQPTFTSSDKYFVHVDTNKFCKFDFRKLDSTTLFLNESPKIYVRYADSFKSLSSKMANLLGHQKLLPDWVYDGVILAMQGGTEVLERKIQTAIDHDIKIVGVWSQDWSGCRVTEFGYQVMWNWEANIKLYAGLKDKIKEWNKLGIKFLGYINPFLAIEGNVYQEAKDKGYCVKNDKGEDYLVQITTFPAAMIDFTNPKAWEWYKSIIKKNMIDFGLSGWMADFGEYLPVDACLYNGDAEAMHNAWPALWAKLNHEAVQEAKRDDLLFFTRAGYTESIKYSQIMWNGDQHVDWSVDDGLPSAIPATLSLAMSGFGMAHNDIGGYTTLAHLHRTKELMLRWVEMNAFSPVYRTHEGNQPKNNVQFDYDEDVLKHFKLFTDVHVALKDYLKEACLINEKIGTPVMRPVFYNYDDMQFKDVSDEYLLGDDILVSPVIKEHAVTKEVLLPEDEWIHLFTSEEYRGGKYTVDAKLACPPVFIRKSSKYKDDLLTKIKEIMK